MTDQGTARTTAEALAGRSVLVFGGTSGIGLATAVQAKAAGAEVVVVGHDRAGAERAAAENGFAGWRAVDVTQSDTIAAALADIPRVDHLVLLAGTFVVGKIMETDVGHLRRAFDERVWAAIHILKTLGERLAPDASVTFISGAMAERPDASGTAVLAAAAATMDALARGLALELAPRRFNAVSPGLTDTPLLSRSFGEHKEAFVKPLTEKLPLHRLGTADEVGAAVVFLMGNGLMTGATLHVDGGFRLV